MKKESVIVIGIVGILSVFLVVISGLVSVTFITSGVIGANQSDTITKVRVWNTDPNITSVVIEPSPIDLTPGNTTQVNCTASVHDYNGWQDINISNATFYHESVASTASDDNNNHYSADLSACDCSQDGVSSTDATCECYFDVWYYALNGTWTCNMTVTDLGGNSTERIYNFNDSKSSDATINTVVALTTPAEIDYGNLSVTETSTAKAANISNFGNVPINISVRGYGGTTDDSNPGNNSMHCDYGNISIDYEKFSFSSGADYSAMTALRNESTYMGLSLPLRTNDTNYGNDTNTSYWKLQIPLAVGGYCNGTLEFRATENS